MTKKYIGFYKLGNNSYLVDENGVTWKRLDHLEEWKIDIEAPKEE